MGKVCPQRSDRNHEIGATKELLVVVLGEDLPSLQDGLEGNGRRSFLDDGVPDLVAELGLVPPVAVPAGKCMVSHQQSHRQGRKGRPYHGQVAGTPHYLADELWMSGYSYNPCFPEMQFRFLDGGDLLEVEDAGIQKEKAQKVDRPGNVVGESILPQIVKLVPVVGVSDKVGDPRIGQAQARKGKDGPPGPGADELFSVRPGRGQPAVNNRKDDSKEQRHQVGISPRDGFHGMQKVVGVSGGRNDPQDGDRREDRGDGGAKGEPAAVAECSPFFLLDVKDAGVLADDGRISGFRCRPPIGIVGLGQKGNAGQIVGGG